MEILRFGLLGLGTGAVYAMLAQGLVLVYRGSGLLNFAQGAMAMVGAYVYYEVSVGQGQSKWLGLAVALVVCALLGAALHVVVLRPMRRSSPLSRVIATLGFTLVLQSLAFLRYGHDPRAVPSLLPTRTVRVVSHDLAIGADRIVIFTIGLVLTVVLTVLYRTTAFGRVTTAVAENQLAAASMGHSPDVVASVNWALGSALGGLAGVLIAPIIFLEPTSLVLLVLPAMSAALLGQFASFPATFAVSLALGVAQSELQRYVSSPGWSTAAPFIAVLAVLAARGQALPLRSFVLDRLPAVGSGRIPVVPVVVIYGLVTWLMFTVGPDWATSLTTTFGVAIVCLSVVVITGYAGQLSLAQAVLAGVGAFTAAKLATHVPFFIALILAAAITAIVGGLVGLPALRTRGVTLAIATLGLGGAVSAVVLSNPKYTGGVSGITVPVPHLFGWSLDPFFHPQRYGFVAWTLLVLVGIGIANLRRGVTGRRLLAVRSNERAAAALGIPNAWVKAYAFMLAAGVAAIGGVLIAFLQPSVEISQTPTFSTFSCILVVAVVVAGGVGSVGGALIGSTMVAGGAVSKLLNGWSSVNDYLPLIGGALLVLVLVFGPDGLFELNRRLVVAVVEPLRHRLPTVPHPHRRRAGVTAGATPARFVAAKDLRISGLCVAFGGVRAVQDVDLHVRPGEVHGLIGPNGAGKTTVIDAVTGFVRAQAGSVQVGGEEAAAWAPRRRARAGLSRSFQSLELFDDLTVLENLAVASEHPRLTRCVTDLVAPGRVTLPPAALEALRQFDLVDLIDKLPSQISFGQRKMVAIARAVAAAPSVLLLDEPAAGLDDREASELAQLISTLARTWGIGVLLVEHKVDMIMSISDTVTVLQEGRVLTSGTPEHVQSDPRVIDAYLGVTTEVAAG